MLRVLALLYLYGNTSEINPLKVHYGGDGKWQVRFEDEEVRAQVAFLISARLFDEVAKYAKRENDLWGALRGIASYNLYQRVGEDIAIAGSIIFEPIDWLVSAKFILDDPTEPLNYAGLLPILPSAAAAIVKRFPKSPRILKEMAEVRSRRNPRQQKSKRRDSC
jgi:hypothetical protein